MEHVRLGKIDFLQFGELVGGGGHRYSARQDHEILAVPHVQRPQNSAAQFIDDLILAMMGDAAAEPHDQLPGHVVGSAGIILWRNVASGGEHDLFVAHRTAVVPGGVSVRQFTTQLHGGIAVG